MTYDDISNETPELKRLREIQNRKEQARSTLKEGYFKLKKELLYAKANFTEEKHDLASVNMILDCAHEIDKKERAMKVISDYYEELFAERIEQVTKDVKK